MFQAVEQFLVNAAESSVAENGDGITLLTFFGDESYDVLDGFAEPAISA